MREVEVRLKRQKLADALGDMREWLDQHDCVPVSFNIVRGRRGALLANVVFKENHIAPTRAPAGVAVRRAEIQPFPGSTA